MSYSFQVKGKTKEEVEALAVEQLNGVVASQPVHRTEYDQTVKAITSYVALIQQPGDEEYITLSISGSVSGYYGGEVPDGFTPTGLNFGFYAQVLPEIKP